LVSSSGFLPTIGSSLISSWFFTPLAGSGSSFFDYTALFSSSFVFVTKAEDLCYSSYLIT